VSKPDPVLQVRNHLIQFFGKLTKLGASSEFGPGFQVSAANPLHDSNQ
jgi:hypothetical protein